MVEELLGGGTHDAPLYRDQSDKTVDLQVSQHELCDRVIKTLNESALPEVYGMARKVIDALSARIGHAPLNIDAVAEELHVSKRTLQRRLREQGFCFSGLRDRLRRAYAIKALVSGMEPIDRLYTALDFSDRSSLALAFKRWTGVSPRAFLRRYKELGGRQRLS